MGKHTPGPWKLNGGIWAGADHICGWPLRSDVGHEAAEANGRLIAAAPDLLEAAKAFDEAVDLASEAGHYINDPRLRAAVRLAREAIEKAEGV